MQSMRFSMGLAALLGATTAQAAGFALIEQNASGLGNAYAGQAAVAEDASTVFFNPAGLTRVEGWQLVLAAHYIAPSAKLADNGSTLAFLGTGGNAGNSAFVPNAYFATGLGPDLKFGIGLNASFGLSTEYDTPWLGQTQGAMSDLKTLNVNPSLAWRLNERLSLGLGVSWQRIEAELTQRSTAPAVTLATMNLETSVDRFLALVMSHGCWRLCLRGRSPAGWGRYAPDCTDFAPRGVAPPCGARPAASSRLARRPKIRTLGRVQLRFLG